MLVLQTKHIKSFLFVLGRLRQDQNVIINTAADEDFFCPKDDHTPMFMSNITFPNISIQAVATSICGDNKQCVFDIAATLLPSFGQSTMNSINEFEQEKAVTGRYITEYFMGKMRSDMKTKPKNFL